MPARSAGQQRPPGLPADGDTGGDSGGGRAAEFERLYRANVADVTAYFARRSTDPQAVADLTAETFTAAITSFGTFDPRKGTARAWVFGIARRVYAAHCESLRQQRAKALRLAGRQELGPDHVAELLDRIDAERAGRALLAAMAELPPLDRAAIELVSIAGLRAAEAASVLGVAPGALRMRLMRARARLRAAASPAPPDGQAAHQDSRWER
jgi:RNA polymerase sigma-70 factor (ECF subfamily)